MTPGGAGGAPAAAASLDAWLDWQTRQHARPIDMGLPRVTAVADRLGLRRDPPLTLTIAGTNGKGAATTLAADILCRAGYRVGRYTSPHLRRYNERVNVAGEDVDDALLRDAFVAIERVRDAVPLTYFEFGTLAALWCFRQCGCEVQVLEVGLGGRLDAVNLLDADAALVTSIGLDHGDWLGHNLAAVAREKAGVFRPGRPAIWADPTVPEGVEDALTKAGVTLCRLGRDYRIADLPAGWQMTGAQGARDWPPPGLPGAHAVRNAAGVIAMLTALSDRLAVSDADIAAALRAWQLPGRCERRGHVLLDVAHNVEAARSLVPILRALPAPVTVVLGMLDDKPVEGVAAALAEVVTAAHLVDLPPPRGLSAAALRARVAPRLPVQGEHATIAAALAACGTAGTVLVCGSFLTVTAALEVLDG